MPYYKIAYSIAFVVILSAIQPVVYANEIGQAVERAVSLLAVVFCADTYLVEVQSKRSEVFCLYNLKKQAGVVYKRLFVQVAYLIGISLLAYGLFYWQKPVNLTEELDGGALFGIYCIAIPSHCFGMCSSDRDSRNCFVLECAFRNCQQSGSKQMDWYGCRAAFLVFLYFRKGNSVFEKLGTIFLRNL